jgi:hypothetical protein
MPTSLQLKTLPTPGAGDLRVEDVYDAGERDANFGEVLLKL